MSTTQIPTFAYYVAYETIFEALTNKPFPSTCLPPRTPYP
jgi:hypothetical protein